MPLLPNSRHEAFAQALAQGQSADEAYQTAGFTANRGNASRLKANENIRERVAEIAEHAANRAEIDIARTLKELVRLGTSDVRRLFDANGNLRPVQDLDDETAAAVSSIEVVTRTLAKNEDGSVDVEHIHKLKLWDKNSALDKIAKHLGMFVERMEHTGKDGAPIRHEVTRIERVIIGADDGDDTQDRDTPGLRTTH